MGNPILQAMGAAPAQTPQLPPQLRNLSKLVNTLRRAKDPQALAQQMLGQNPAMRQALQYVQQNGGDPRGAAEKLAKDRGVDLPAVMNGLR